MQLASSLQLGSMAMEGVLLLVPVPAGPGLASSSVPLPRLPRRPALQDDGVHPRLHVHRMRARPERVARLSFHAALLQLPILGLPTRVLLVQTSPLPGP